ncbi:peptidoglycan metallopeptidase Pgp3 [Sulfurimonas sp.]
MRLLLFCMFLSFNLQAALIGIVNDTIANGKTSLLEFSSQKGVKYFDVQLDNKKYKIFQNPQKSEQLYALIPISYYDKPAIKELIISYTENGKNKHESIFLKVVAGAYAKENISVESSKVNPKSPEVKKRISKEYVKAMKIYHRVTPKSYIHKPFIMPMESKITSDFGKARVYNGSLNGYHSGTDFRAKVGTPIQAANDGVVALVAKRFYSGGTVLLNHGEGIYTCYFHMSQFNVKEGEHVKRGDLLGLSGKSGRVTGPHLHFSARIDGIQVDPLQLISLLNNNLLKEN